MPFDRTSFAETRDLLVAFGRALFSGLNFTSRRSYHGKRATFMSASVTTIMSHVDSAERDLHPLTAGEGKPINDWGGAVGVPIRGATPARKSKAARVRGNAGGVLPINAQLQEPSSGLIFEITQAVTIPGTVGVDPDSFVDADIAGIDVGSQTRLEAGTTLRFLGAPPEIQTDVVLQLDLDEGGVDVEQFGSYRGRVLSTFSETPSGGNQNDFIRWAIESLPSVATAFAYPNRSGRGTMDVAAFYAGSGSARSLTSDDRAAVLAYIKTKAPFQVSGEGGGLRVLTTLPDPQRIEITLETNGITAFAFDWDDSAHPTVLSWTPSTRELRWSIPLPASLHAGHSLILDGVASAQDGREFRIESISGSDKVILEKAPAANPAATDKIYSGGPLVTPVRDAIVAHLNGEIVYAGRGLTPIPASSAAPGNPTGPSIIGLDELAIGIGSSNPGGKYGAWSGGILLSTLFKIATYKAGVRRAVIISPVADYEPEDDGFPLQSQIHYVTPSVVIVRGA